MALMYREHLDFKLGYRHASTGMGSSNHRANLLHTNTGFRVVDTQYQLFKDLDDPLPGFGLDVI